MKAKNMIKSGLAAAALAVALGGTVLPIAPAMAQKASAASGKTVVLSIGRGQQVNLSSPVTDVFVADSGIANVDVKSSKQIYIIGKGVGETTVYATDAAGRTIYTAQVRVGGNLDSLQQMLLLAMPEAQIQVTTMNGVVLLTGSVAQPEDVAEAERLTKAFVGENMAVVSRLKNVTPLQVNLQVRFAEVSRTLAKEIAGNLKTQDNSGGGFLGGVYTGRDIADITTSAAGADFPLLDASAIYGLPAGSISLPFNPATGQFVAGDITNYKFNIPAGGNVLAAAGKLFGVNVAAALDMSERAGLVSTLANPNLTTVSGEPAEFRAGGEFPIPIANGLGATSVEFRPYGVGLTYTPVVMSDGRISLRIKTEVSDISSAGAVRLGGLEIPAIATRMAETTVELGSGQSFMIAGLLSNTASSSVSKMPGLGDVPVLGALFKSNGWKRNETELMIIVTPYLVKPVSEGEIKLPTDGMNTPNDLERVLLGKVTSNKGQERPMPTVAPDAPKGPDFGSVSEAAPALPKKAPATKAASSASSAPGFSFDN